MSIRAVYSLSRILALAGIGLVCCEQPRASAHFFLVAPDANRKQDSSGSPQKAPPCGEEGTVTATMKVTDFKAGDTIDITIKETVFHPGHYRVAIAPSPDQLPPEPIVTAADTPCGSVPIMDPPVYPVLGDGLLQHSTPFSGNQTMSVKLPADFSCTKCTLQIIEFMGEHGLNVPGGCFYHHCADISVQGPPPAAAQDAGSSDAGSSDAGSGDAGGHSASMTGLDASAAGDTAAHTPASPVDASAGPLHDAAADAPSQAGSHDSGCALARSGPSWSALATSLLALTALLTRRRARRV